MYTTDPEKYVCSFPLGVAGLLKLVSSYYHWVPFKISRFANKLALPVPEYKIKCFYSPECNQRSKNIVSAICPFVSLRQQSKCFSHLTISSTLPNHVAMLYHVIYMTPNI